jgi:hypothetical protein
VEHDAENQMGQKVRVQTMYEIRNGLPTGSLGDKIYKAPEYQTGFFYDGGLKNHLTRNISLHKHQHPHLTRA